jgi:hypothetical protein
MTDLILHVYIHRYHKLYVKFALADGDIAAIIYVKVLMFVVSKGLDFGLLSYHNKQARNLGRWFSKTLVTTDQT